MADAAVIPLYLVPRGAQPRPRQAARPNDVDRLRLLQCPRYSGCLNFAARLNWSGFHCSNCPFFAEHQAALAEKYGLDLAKLLVKP